MTKPTFSGIGVWGSGFGVRLGYCLVTLAVRSYAIPFARLKAGAVRSGIIVLIYIYIVFMGRSVLQDVPDFPRPGNTLIIYYSTLIGKKGQHIFCRGKGGEYPEPWWALRWIMHAVFSGRGPPIR